MKKIRPVLAFFLAGLVTLSSVGVTISQHICMGQVRSIAVFVKAKNCGMPETMAGSMKMKNCCDEKTILIKTKTTSASVSKSLNFSPSVFIAAVLPLQFLYVIIPESSRKAQQFAVLKPPLPERDILVLTHSFLI